MNRMTKITAAGALALFAGHAAAQVQHGYLNVVEIDGGNTEASVSTTRVGGDGVWAPFLNDTSNANSRGDFPINFFTASDTTMGVLIVGTADTTRVEPSYTYEYVATPATARNNTTGRYWIAMHSAPAGSEANFDASLAFFPIADGWLTAGLYNTANNAAIEVVVGTPGIQIRNESTYTGQGIEVLDFTLGGFANGFYMLNVPGTDLRRDGLILINGARNEDNRADVFTNYDGTAILHCIDNGSESGGENDDVAFVFIPEGTAGVTMASVSGCGKALFRQGDFAIEMFGQPDTNGTYRVTIAGESPTTGTLIACGASELSGTTIDNSLCMRPDGDGWVIETRDTEPLPTGMVLQDLAASDVIFHFAFFKNGVAIQPGTPARSYLPRMDDIVAARFTVTEFNANNGLGDMRTDRSSGSDALDAYGDNKGDNGISWLGARLAARNIGPASGGANLDAHEGVMMPVSTQFFRDNSATGGTSGWSTVGFAAGEVRHHAASIGAEINADFALAFFPAVLGLQQDAGIDIVAEPTVSIAGNAAADGVLMATNGENNNRFVTVGATNGSYTLTLTDGGTGLPVTGAGLGGYIYLPYSGFENFVAGQVAADASISSGTGNFAVATGLDALGFDVTTITIPGVDARTDGVLLVTSMQSGVTVAMETGANGEFEVAGLDVTTLTAGRCAFAFAYIPYEGLTIAEPGPDCDPDVNCDGVPDQDDVACIILAVAGDLGCFCQADPDFNRDGVPDQDDVAAVILTVAGAPCP